MKHLKQVSVSRNLPNKAMATNELLMLIGTIMTSIGALLMGISPFFGGKLD